MDFPFALSLQLEIYVPVGIDPVRGLVALDVGLAP